MNLWQVTAVAIVIAVACATLKDSGGRLVPFVLTAGGLALLGWSLVRVTGVLTVVEAWGKTALSPYLTVILKALGVGYVVRFGGDLCRDLGSESTAAKLELCGKAELMVLSLPYLQELIELAVTLTGEGL